MVSPIKQHGSGLEWSERDLCTGLEYSTIFIGYHLHVAFVHQSTTSESYIFGQREGGLAIMLFPLCLCNFNMWVHCSLARVSW